MSNAKSETPVAEHRARPRAGRRRTDVGIKSALSIGAAKTDAVLRLLVHSVLSQRAIAKRVGVSQASVHRVLTRYRDQLGL
jgi:predicted DNA-binding protein (UPF0251 family)